MLETLNGTQRTDVSKTIADPVRATVTLLTDLDAREGA